jgi:small subunit ribosomal protein S6
MSETRQYEVVYIVTPDAGEDVVADLHKQVEAIVQRFGGNIEKTENWGRRRLAYDIAHHREGTYVLEVINGPGELVHELDRRLKVIDQVVRHLVVRVDEELRVAGRAKAKRRSESERRRAARGLPPLAEGEEPRRRSEEQDEAPDGEVETTR